MKRVRFIGPIMRALPGLEHVQPYADPPRATQGWTDYSEMPIHLAVSYVYSRGNFRGRRGDIVRDARSPGWDNLCPRCGRPR